ncbi:hypothetical protein R3P38DRAFT_3072765 [Favolaschia claudopus]|uniref:Uncharacterized protein n=1 Tax=Favolaschia claudopus TaxID=2862362 RepID=A0AAV9ZZ74_9AGAR
MLHLTPVECTDIGILDCKEQTLAGGVMRKRRQDDVPSDKLAGLYSPIVLTHACHLLREIARATPELWRAINLVSLLQQRAGKDAALAGPMWLRYSGCLPISLKYDCHYEAMQDSLDGGLLATLAQYLSRLEHLVLYSCQRPLSRFTVAISSATLGSPATLVFSFLKTLQIVPYWAQLFHLMTIRAPALRTLHISEHILLGDKSQRICALQEFITRLCCSLHELKIKDANIRKLRTAPLSPEIQSIEVL